MEWTHRRLNAHLLEYSNNMNNVLILRNDEDWAMGRPHYVVTIGGVYIRGCETLELLKDFVNLTFPEYGFYSLNNNTVILSRPQWNVPT